MDAVDSNYVVLLTFHGDFMNIQTKVNASMENKINGVEVRS